jgi:hypothetical protein
VHARSEATACREPKRREYRQATVLARIRYSLRDLVHHFRDGPITERLTEALREPVEAFDHGESIEICGSPGMPIEEGFRSARV